MTVGMIDLYLRYQRARVRHVPGPPVAITEKLADPKRVVACLSADARIPPLVLPALKLLRERHPHIRLLLISGASNISTLRREGIADKALILHQKRGTYQLSEIWKLGKEISRLQPNLLLLFDPSGDSALHALAYACQVPLRIGFGRGENYPFLNYQMAPPRSSTYLADSLLKMVGSLTGQFVDFLDDRVRLQVSEQEARKAGRLLRFWQPRSQKPLFAVEPGREKREREPDLDKFAAVARLLSRAHGARIMILAPPEDRPYAEKLRRKLTAVEPYRAPTEDLPQTVAFLSWADLLVTSNTPLFHYAVAIGVPVVGLFPESAEPWWHPPVGVQATLLPIHREITEEQFLRVVDSVAGQTGEETR